MFWAVEKGGLIMARVDTLTAYLCKFSYMQRNNPLLEKQREDIKSGKKPAFTFEEFIALYGQSASDVLIGESADRTISLSDENILPREFEGAKSWYISSKAGKQGQPMTVVKYKTGKRYDFGSDTAALYNHHIFIYENDNGIIAIFHRQNGSGCKSVFLETANDILRLKGLKLEMELLVPTFDNMSEMLASKITLQYVKPNDSSDIADNIRKKKTVVREVGLNLEVRDNSKIANIVHNMQMGKIGREQAFLLIKEEVGDTADFNEAEVKFRIGKRTKKVLWSDFENIAGVHDISAELHAGYKKTGKFVEELTKLSDKYFYEITQSGVADNE